MTSEATTLGDVVKAEGSGPWLAGIIPPVCTPLTPEGEVDTLSLERLVSFLLDGGVNGLFMLGSSGEAAFLTDAQRDTVLEVAIKTNAGQVPLLAGTIDMTTNRVLDHAARARDLGADAIVATAPFYVRTGHPAEVELHFKTVRDHAGLPVIAYDIPVAVHHKLEVPVVVELASEGIIDAVKDSSGDLNSFRILAGRTRSLAKFSLLTGSELIVDCSVFVGGDGAVPGLANVDPHGFVALYEHCRTGDWDKARQIQERLVRLFEITACADPSTKGPSSSGLGGFKTALMLRGVIASNAMALPQITLAPAEVEAVRAVLEAQELI